MKLIVSCDVILPWGDRVSFRDQVKQAQTPTRRCGLGDAIRSMDPDFATEVCEALHDPTLQSTTMTDMLKDMGYKINRWQIMQCRKACECGAIPEEEQNVRS